MGPLDHFYLHEKHSKIHHSWIGFRPVQPTVFVPFILWASFLLGKNAILKLNLAKQLQILKLPSLKLT